MVVDIFAGSGAVGEAALNKGRFAILMEIMRENVEKMAKRLNATKIYAEQLLENMKKKEKPAPVELIQLALF